MKKLRFRDIKRASQWTEPGLEPLPPKTQCSWYDPHVCSHALLSPTDHFSLGPQALLLQLLPQWCLPQMKKRSVSGHAGVSGRAEVSGLTGASDQGACLLVPQGTPYPGTCHCMSRKSGKARIQCWTLQSVLWSESLVRALSELGAEGAREEPASGYWLQEWGVDRSPLGLSDKPAGIKFGIIYYWKDNEITLKKNLKEKHLPLLIPLCWLETYVHFLHLFPAFVPMLLYFPCSCLHDLCTILNMTFFKLTLISKKIFHVIS